MKFSKSRGTETAMLVLRHGLDEGFDDEWTVSLVSPHQFHSVTFTSASKAAEAFSQHLEDLLVEGFRPENDL